MKQLVEQNRFHQQVKSRFSNPTFASTNIGSSLNLHVPYHYRSNSFKEMEKQYQCAQSAQKRIAIELQQFRNRSNCNLSNYGSNSLKALNQLISDKQVYQKQQKKYNIINVQPKSYQDTIQVYPKYRLENLDHNYYQKLQIESHIAAQNIIKQSEINHSYRSSGLQSRNPEVQGKQPMKSINHM